MSEAIWLTSNDPMNMYNLPGLREQTTNRRVALLGAAIARRWQWLPATFTNVIDTIESYADGLTPRETVDSVLEGILQDRSILRSEQQREAMMMLHRASRDAETLFGVLHSACEVELAASGLQGEVWITRDLPAIAEVACLLRDLFGNPFRVITFPNSWRTDTTVPLAQRIYDARDFGAMPILADALQEAGCPEQHPILSHCRSGGPHGRGCWIVDRLLCRE